LRLTPFYKAFLVTTDVPEIYMQEFWVTAIVHHHLIRFKMNNEKCIVNLEYFREMLHICPRIPNQTFDELPFERDIIVFLRYLGHSGEIKKIIDNTQQFGAMLPVKLTNEDIENSAADKEYYAIASGAAPPKTKASVKKTHSSSDTTMPPPTAIGTRLLTSAKGKQPAKSSKAKGLSVLSEVALTEAEQIKLATKRSLQQTHISQASGSGAYEGTGIILGDVDDQSNADDDDDDDDQEDEDEQDDDDQDDNDDDQDTDNDGDDFQDDERHGMNVGGDEGPNAEDDDEELYRDVNINLEVNPDGQQQKSPVSSQFVTSMFNPSPDAGIDSLFESTPRVDVPVTTTIVPLLVTTPNLPPPSIPIMSQDLPNFGSLFGFNHRLKTLEAKFSEFMQTNQFAKVVSSIPDIVERYIDHRMNEAVKVAILDTIIKEQVKEQVKVQVLKILPKIKKTVNEQLEAEVLTRSSTSSKTSYTVAADLSKLELKKILIKRMERNKIQPWISDLAKQADSRASFNELMDTPVDFSAFLMNQLNVDTLTPELLVGPTYELMKGSCKNLVELEFFLKEVYKAKTDQLD
nr:hypothetical protein [Tanacetum cinerariifolium]